MQDSPSDQSGIQARFTVAQRLSRKEGFDHVMRAKRIAGLCFNVFFVSNNKKNARLGVVASKKALPAAVARNRVKRMIREIFRQHKISTQNLDLVVMVKGACIREMGRSSGELTALFNRVDDKCAAH